MSDSSPFGFGKFVPGFDFLQSLAKGASSGIPQMPQLNSWVAPTISVEELEKRIEELKAVQFWLEQNSRALTATIQALEVQKMTLATLQGMNMRMGDVANAFKFQGADSVMQGMQKAAETFTGAARSAASAAAPQPAQPASAPSAPTAPPEPPASSAHQTSDATNEADAADVQEQASADANADAEGPAAKPGVVDPLHWWSALTTQFQEIASTALKDVAQRNSTLDSTQHFAKDALKKATDMASHLAAQGMHNLQEVARAAQSPKATPRKASAERAAKAPAKSTGRSATPARKTAAKKAPVKKAAVVKKPAAKKAAAPKPAPAQKTSRATRSRG